MSEMFVVYRTDRTDGKGPSLRAELRPQHREYMAGFASRVRSGGPLLDAQGNGVGGLMIIEAESEAEVWEIVRADPFEQAELSGRIEVYAYRWQTARPADLPPL